MSLPCFCVRGFTWRSLHATLAVVATVPLLTTITSGALYRFSRAVLLYEKPSVQFLLSIHTLSFLSLHTVYPIILGLLALALFVTSLPLSPMSTLVTSPSLANLRALLPASLTRRTLHRTGTLLIGSPFLTTALTGMAWTVSRYYLHHTKDDAAWLMDLHQGGYTGSPVLYTAALAVLSLAAFVPGLMLTAPWRAAFPAPQPKDRVRYTMLAVKNAFEREEDTDTDEAHAAPSSHDHDHDVHIHADSDSASGDGNDTRPSGDESDAHG